MLIADGLARGAAHRGRRRRRRRRLRQLAVRAIRHTRSIVSLSLEIDRRCDASDGHVSERLTFFSLSRTPEGKYVFPRRILLSLSLEIRYSRVAPRKRLGAAGDHHRRAARAPDLALARLHQRRVAPVHRACVRRPKQFVPEFHPRPNLFLAPDAGADTSSPSSSTCARAPKPSHTRAERRRARPARTVTDPRLKRSPRALAGRFGLRTVVLKSRGPHECARIHFGRQHGRVSTTLKLLLRHCRHTRRPCAPRCPAFRARVSWRDGGALCFSLFSRRCLTFSASPGVLRSIPILGDFLESLPSRMTSPKQRERSETSRFLGLVLWLACA